MNTAGRSKSEVIAGIIAEHQPAPDKIAPDWKAKAGADIMRFLDQAERREVAALGDPFVALMTLIQYADFTIGPDSPCHHPTMPSAVAAAKGAMRSLYRGFRGMEFDPAKPGPKISFGGDMDDETCSQLGEAIVGALASVQFFKEGSQPLVSPEMGMAMTEARQAMDSWRHVETLRSQEGDSVEILCDNPDGLCAVVVSGDWTGFTPRRVEGVNIHEALSNAALSRATGETPPVPAPAPKAVVEHLMGEYDLWIKKCKLRTVMSLTPEGKMGQRYLDGEDAFASEVILQLMHAIESLIRRSGAKTCLSLTPAGQMAEAWLAHAGLEYHPRREDH